MARNKDEENVFFEDEEEEIEVTFDGSDEFDIDEDEFEDEDEGCCNFGDIIRQINDEIERCKNTAFEDLPHVYDTIHKIEELFNRLDYLTEGDRGLQEIFEATTQSTEEIGALVYLDKVIETINQCGSDVIVALAGLKLFFDNHYKAVPEELQNRVEEVCQRVTEHTDLDPTVISFEVKDVLEAVGMEEDEEEEE